MSEMPDRFLIAGLGNPGRKHKKNRHNFGFVAIDVFAARYGLTLARVQHNALIADGRVENQRVMLAKPQSYMNNSGGPLSGLVSFYKLPFENLMVVYDDLDLPLGTIRIKASGSGSGQNGMRDVIRHLGSNHVPRLRLGIGRPPGRMDPIAYVLKEFGKSELMLVEETLERAADALETWLSEGITLAMSRYNGPAPDGN